MHRIACTNRFHTGQYCNATRLFVPKDVKDLHVVLPPCKNTYEDEAGKKIRCGAMLQVDIDLYGECVCKVFRSRLDADNMPLMAEGTV